MKGARERVEEQERWRDKRLNPNGPEFDELNEIYMMWAEAGDGGEYAGIRKKYEGKHKRKVREVSAAPLSKYPNMNRQESSIVS